MILNYLNQERLIDFEYTVDSASNKYGYNKIFVFLNIHFLKPIFLIKDITMKGERYHFF